MLDSFLFLFQAPEKKASPTDKEELGKTITLGAVTFSVFVLIALILRIDFARGRVSCANLTLHELSSCSIFRLRSCSVFLLFSLFYSFGEVCYCECVHYESHRHCRLSLFNCLFVVCPLVCE